MNARLPGDNSSKPTPSAMASEVIDRLYEVAVDPSRYEELLDKWETMISPYRRGQGLDQPISFAAIDFESHFKRASQVLGSIRPGESDRGEPEATLDRFESSAAFSILRDLTVGAVNGPAAALGLGSGDPLTRLPLTPEDAGAFGAQVSRLLASNAETQAMFRTRVQDKSRLIVFQLRVLHPQDRPPYVIAVTSELLWPSGFDAFLKNVFNLTEAEAQVLRALSECHSIKEIAELRGRSVATVRAQLKSLQAKTETRSQAELVRLTLSTMDIAQFTQDAAADYPSESRGYETLQPRPFHSLALPDGRRMEYLILGDPKGRPCLYSPQDYGLTRWPASAEAEAARRGIKVIVPVRAGYGHSTPLPRNALLSQAIIADLVFLLDHLGVVACPVISMGDDFYISAHLGQQHPTRVTALIACAGVLPLTRADQYERMDKWYRFILAGARYTPHLLPFMVKAGMALAQKLGKRGFVHAVFGNSPADIETFENPEVFEAMVIGSEVCLSKEHTAHAAFSAKVREQETTDWRPAVLSLRDTCPVHFLNGLQDPQAPPETLAEHAHDYPWIDFTTYKDAGQLVFFRKWVDVLDLLEKYL